MLTPKFFENVPHKNVLFLNERRTQKTSAKREQTCTTSQKSHFSTVFIQAVLPSLTSVINIA